MRERQEKETGQGTENWCRRNRKEIWQERSKRYKKTVKKHIRSWEEQKKNRDNGERIGAGETVKEKRSVQEEAKRIERLGACAVWIKRWASCSVMKQKFYCSPVTFCNIKLVKNMRCKEENGVPLEFESSCRPWHHRERSVVDIHMICIIYLYVPYPSVQATIESWL